MKYPDLHNTCAEIALFSSPKMSSRRIKPLKMPSKETLKIMTVNPQEEKRRVYNRVEDVEDFKELIRDKLLKGQSQEHILAILEEHGVLITLHQLKYILRKWGFSRVNQKRQKHGASRMLTPPSEGEDSDGIEPSYPAATFATTSLSGTIDFDFQGVEHPNSEIFVPIGHAQVSAYPLEYPPKRKLRIETLRGPVRPDIVSCSKQHKSQMKKWLRMRRNTARYVLRLVQADMLASEESEEVCYNRLNWNRYKRQWKEDTGDHEVSALPPWVYRSFLEKRNDDYIHEYSDEEIEESLKLKKIFEKVFDTLLNFGVHAEDSSIGDHVRSIAVHVVTIEEMFGPTHMLLVEAINIAGGLLNQVEDGDSAAVIALTKIELQKLERMNLASSYNTAHGLVHLRRALEVSGDLSGAIEAEQNYYAVRCRVNQGRPFPRTLMMIQSAQELCINGDSEWAFRELEKILTLLEKGDALVGSLDFSFSHGHVSTGFDYRSLAHAFLDIERFLLVPDVWFEDYCLPKAAESFQKAIEHFKAKEYKIYPEKLYQTMRDVAKIYFRMGELDLALSRFLDHYSYRTVYGPNDTSAANSLRAIAKVLATGQSVGYNFSSDNLKKAEELVLQARLS